MGCCQSNTDGQTNQQNQIQSGGDNKNVSHNEGKSESKDGQQTANNDINSKNEQKYLIDEQQKLLKENNQLLDLDGNGLNLNEDQQISARSNQKNNSQYSQASTMVKKILPASQLFNDFTIKKPLKETEIFQTFQVERKEGVNKNLIMKKIKKKVDSKDQQKQINQTIEVYQNVDYRNIIYCLQTYEDEQYRYFIMEYYTGGNLLEKLKKYDNYNEKICSRIFRQIIGNICHRNLRLEKFLFQSDSPSAHVLKLIDFTHCCKIIEGKKENEQIGSQYYVCPEILSKKPYDQSCDMWSLGVILYILLSGEHPFQGSTINEILFKTVNAQFEFKSDMWGNISEAAKDIKMLKKEPEQRLTANEAYAHPWIQQNFSVEQLESKIIKKLQTFQSDEQLLTQEQFQSFSQYLQSNEQQN